MPRKNRLFIPGMPHLAQLRGHNGEELFRHEEDYSAFERCMQDAAQRYAVSIHSWSLAIPRILLLVSAPDKQALSRFIQHIGRSYVPYYNRRYQRHGALWDSRYLCSPLEPETYFLAVKRFIECDEDGSPGCHSHGNLPSGLIVPHPVWLKLGENEQQRQAHFQEFCRQPVNRALVTRIRHALAQNCLLASLALSQQLEAQMERPLRARHCGRPRKYESSPSEQWTWLELQAEQFLRQHGYQQIRLPLLEHTSLFAPGGPVMADKGKLRGDGTTGCLRLMADNPHTAVMSRIWYSGAMFRQRSLDGDIRQNHQIGVEAFGMPGVDIELEHLVMQAVFFRRIGLGEMAELHINMLGDEASLAAFRRALRDYYQPISRLLNPEQQHWLEKHPEWLIHHEDILLQRLAPAAPCLADFITVDSRHRFQRLQHALTQAGIAWQYDPALFPANDYCQLVFEWRSIAMKRELIISRGGRYDACASRIAEKPVSACGFAFMMEPIVTLLGYRPQPARAHPPTDIVIIAGQPRVAAKAMLLGRSLRQQFPYLSIINDCSPQRISTRYKNSRRLGARFILEIEGDGETIILSDSRDHRFKICTLDNITDRLAQVVLSQ
ncbi:TPA: ATP phosphoribosyltransferase regulatory subunit [Klebsiella aerogenes]|nr:ATP phosphoribosyltransferase regulatory subunit [Klebsiella aerogenes]HCT3706986.1 ATP phosphoribosyltransferase regulatory subunit [Klebsiella aerogenes]